MFQKLVNEPVVFMTRTMWKHAGDQKRTYILMLLLSIAGRLSWLLPAYIFGKLLNTVQAQGVTQANIHHLLTLTGMIFAVSVVGWLFHGPSRILERSLAFKIDRYYKSFLYRAVLSRPLIWHVDRDSGNTIDKVNKATEALFEYSRSTFQIISVLVRLVVVMLVLVYFNVYMALVVVVIFVATFYILNKFNHKLIPEYDELNSFDNKSQAKVFDALSNVTTIKVLRIEDPILEGINTSWWLQFSLYLKNKILVEWKWFTGSTFFDLLIVLPIGIYIYHSYTSGTPMMVGTLSFLFMYLSEFHEIYYTIAGTYDEITIQKSRILGVSDIENEYLEDSKAHKNRIGNWQKILLENIKFSYGAGSARHSIDIDSIEFKRGEKVAVIGESGAGKSTLLKVLHGMYDVENLRLFIDGVLCKDKFSDIDLQSTLVPQEPEVFSASIAENITLLMEYSDLEIESAVRMAEFSEVLAALPKGLESVVNEKGVNLSGGQKQRLALARALLFSKNKKIIFLDESTSSVDPVNEVKIYKNIFENFKEVTVLASIHKMNLLKYFDRIVVLDAGRVRVSGTLSELLENDPWFRASWDEFNRQDLVV